MAEKCCHLEQSHLAASVSENGRLTVSGVSTINSLRPRPLDGCPRSVWVEGEADLDGQRVFGMNSSRRQLNLLL